MAKVRKRSWQSGGETKTAWVADYLDDKGGRRQKTFKTRKAADSWLLETRTAVAAGRHLVESTSPTVAMAADSWLADRTAHGVERSALQSYGQHIRLHILPRLGSVKVAKLTDQRIKSARDDLLRSLSRPLASKVMITLRALLRHAGRTVDVRLEREPGRHKKKLEIGHGIPTAAEVRELINHAQQPAKAIFALAALAGLRASEIRGLRWQDVDLTAGTVTVRQRADAWGVIGSPKSDDAKRTIPTGPQLVSILEELGPGDGLLIPSKTGTPQLLGNLRKRVIGPVKLHALRHFYASWCLSRGIPLGTLRQYLGHSTVVLTADLYSHLVPATDKEREKLAAAEAELLH
jgi:integrase